MSEGFILSFWQWHRNFPGEQALLLNLAVLLDLCLKKETVQAFCQYKNVNKLWLSWSTKQEILCLCFYLFFAICNICSFWFAFVQTHGQWIIENYLSGSLNEKWLIFRKVQLLHLNFLISKMRLLQHLASKDNKAVGMIELIMQWDLRSLI